MSVGTETSRTDYTGDASTLAFPTGFFFLADADLRVSVITAGVAVVKTLNVDYTVTDAGNPSGGTVHFVAAPAVATTVRVERLVPLTQGVDFHTAGPFSPNVITAQMDRATMMAQQLQRQVADNATSSAAALAAEAATRASAVSGETAVRAAADTAETAARVAADTALANAIASAGVGSGLARVHDIGETDLSLSGEARFRLRGTNLEVSIDGGPWVPLATSGVFVVRNYAGGYADGTTDNTAAINAAIADATAFVLANSGNPATVFFHQGVYRYSSPFFLTPQVNIVGEGRNAAQFLPIASPACHCYPFMAVPRLDNGYGFGPEALGSYVAGLRGSGGTALFADYHASGGAANGNFFFNLSQSIYGRLPAGNAAWTINFDRKVTTLTAFAPLFSIGGLLYTDQRPQLLSLTTADGTTLKLQFRYNNLAYDVDAAFTGQPTALHTNTLMNFEVSWSGTQMRLFLNGELWTLGAWTPSGGLGSADSSGMLQFAEESMTIGSGSPLYGFADEVGAAYMPGTWDNFHFSDGVRHTATFTVPSTRPTPDGTTRILFDCGTRYKGCVVAKGALGLHNIYLYPWVQVSFETGGIKFQNLYFNGGMGLYGEFNSTMRCEEVTYLGAEDSVRFTRNGYYSHFRNMDIIGAGRIGLNIQGGSYVDMSGIKASAPICYLSNGGNIVGMNINASINGNGSIGLFCTQGTIELTGFNIDAEDNTGATPWYGAVHAKDMIGLKLNSCTLYNPLDKRVNDSIIWVNRTAGGFDATIVIDTPTIIGSSAAPLIYTFGTEQYFARPVVLRSPCYLISSFSDCNIPTNVVNPDKLAAVIRLGAAAPTVGTWARSSIILNSAASSGGFAGWICTTAGTPGTWKTWGVIS